MSYENSQTFLTSYSYFSPNPLTFPWDTDQEPKIPYSRQGTCFACSRPRFNLWHHIWSLKKRHKEFLSITGKTQRKMQIKVCLGLWVALSGKACTSRMWPWVLSWEPKIRLFFNKVCVKLLMPTMNIIQSPAFTTADKSHTSIPETALPSPSATNGLNALSQSPSRVLVLAHVAFRKIKSKKPKVYK